MKEQICLKQHIVLESQSHRIKAGTKLNLTLLLFLCTYDNKIASNQWFVVTQWTALMDEVTQYYYFTMLKTVVNPKSSGFVIGPDP